MGLPTWSRCHNNNNPSSNPHATQRSILPLSSPLSTRRPIPLSTQRRSPLGNQRRTPLSTQRHSPLSTQLRSPLSTLPRTPLHNLLTNLLSSLDHSPAIKRVRNHVQASK